MTVKVLVQTVAKDFPNGTTDTTYVFNILDSTGATVASQEVVVTEVDFDGLADGTYTAQVTKNGVTATSDPFVVSTTVSLQVPQTVTVSFS